MCPEIVLTSAPGMTIILSGSGKSFLATSPPLTLSWSVTTIPLRPLCMAALTILSGGSRASRVRSPDLLLYTVWQCVSHFWSLGLEFKEPSSAWSVRRRKAGQIMRRLSLEERGFGRMCRPDPGGLCRELTLELFHRNRLTSQHPKDVAGSEPSPRGWRPTATLFQPLVRRAPKSPPSCGLRRSVAIGSRVCRCRALG